MNEKNNGVDSGRKCGQKSFICVNMNIHSGVSDRQQDDHHHIDQMLPKLFYLSRLSKAHRNQDGVCSIVIRECVDRAGIRFPVQCLSL